MPSPPRPAAPIVAALLLGLAGCGDRKPVAPPKPPGEAAAIPRSASPEPPALKDGERWDLLLVTLDTVRADVLTRLGSPRVVAPNVEQLASEGALLTAADTVTPLTLPAHCSIMTGLYPGAHGVRHNARYALGAEHVTLATALRGAGYETAAFVAAFPLSPEYGTSQGFDTYDAAFERTRGVDSERPASAVNAKALPWLRSPHDKPRFTWVHYFDAHDPYAPPEPQASRFRGQPYLGEVATADAALGELLKALRESGRLDRTLVIVSADHGEGLGEHGEPFHGLLLHGSTVHVPIVFWGGPLRRQSREITFPTSVVDIMPTALALLSVPAPPGVQGLDLSASLRGEGPAPSRPGALSESWYGYLEFGWSPLRGLSDGERRYIEAPSPELYDVLKDPHETTNIAATEDRRAASLRAALLQQEAATRHAGASGSAAQPMTQQQLEALQSLGYVAAGGGVDVDASSVPAGPDPKAMIGLYEKYNQARARLDSGDARGALALLEEIVPQDPKNLQFRGKHAKALAWSGRFDEAESEWRSMIAQDPKYVHAYWDLSVFYDLLGRTRAAIGVLRQMQAADPSYVGITERIAGLQATLGEPAAAIALLTAPPATGDRLAQAGRIALRSGDAKRAVDLLESALRATPPGAVEPWLLEAARQEADGQGGQALLALKREADAHPRETAAWSELCAAALRQDANDLALASCTTLTSLPGHEPPEQASVVRALLRAGRLDEARSRTDALLQGNPGWWWLHRAWAEELARRGDAAASRASAQAWARLDPDSAAARSALAR